jgi:hypothetical protein
VPGDMPKVSSPVSTTVPVGQVNGVHDNVVQNAPAPPEAHAEPNGFNDFDPRGSVPGIILSCLSVHYLSKMNSYKLPAPDEFDPHVCALTFSLILLICIVFQILPLQQTPHQ